RVPYLGKRGITEEVQRIFGIGYDKENKAVMIPWTDYKGNIVNLKFRSTATKMFWYHKEGQPLRYHLFGLHLICKKKITRVFCTESETDAMYLWSIGVPAIAFGRAGMSPEQKKLLLRSPIEELVIASDNDKAGRAFAERLRQELIGIIVVENLSFPIKYKDVNDIPMKELLSTIEKNVEKKSFYMFLQL
ncbi:toprim domain-containing protein, partial [Clostridium perfringens]|uniref:toprim domain-containing protein n=1 Tax=Clostridium perfringens TaxID=1502 RepID=UPI002AC4CD60